MNKKGKGEVEMIFGVIIFVIIMGIFISSGVLVDIINAFNIPEFGSYGIILGGLFVLMIIIGILSKIFER